MTDLPALIARLGNALYYAYPRQTVKLKREVAEAIRDALVAGARRIDALEAELARRPPPRTAGRAGQGDAMTVNTSHEHLARQMQDAEARPGLADGFAPYRELVAAALFEADARGAFTFKWEDATEQPRRHYLKLADAALAALPAPHVPKQEPAAALAAQLREWIEQSEKAMKRHEANDNPDALRITAGRLLALRQCLDRIEPRAQSVAQSVADPESVAEIGSEKWLKAKGYQLVNDGGRDRDRTCDPHDVNVSKK